MTTKCFILKTYIARLNNFMILCLAAIDSLTEKPHSFQQQFTTVFLLPTFPFLAKFLLLNC